MAQLQQADFVAHMNDDAVHRNMQARMFEHPVLEALSKVHPSVPLLIYVPAIGYFAWQSIAATSVSMTLLILAVGGLVWTLSEYTLHRWLFHFPDTTPTGRFIYFYTHGIHHHYPDDPSRLVMIPTISLPFAALFYLLFAAVFPVAWVAGVMSGFLIGYLVYDYAHFATHFVVAPKHPALAPLAAIMKEQRRRHMIHHFKDHSKGYGVSCALWDHVFGTTIPPKP